MRLLVTGGAGFIGCNFVRLALERGHGVTVLDKLTYAGRKENLADVLGRINFAEGDIRKRADVARCIADCDAVLNFAAETHVDRSIINAGTFVKTDVLGTYALLEACRKRDVKKFIQISCYDEKTRALTTEGLKTYKELKEGDSVFSLNPKTKGIESKSIEKVIIQPYEGTMIHFNNKRIDLLVTPNHNMFIRNYKKELIIETSEKASQRSIFYMPEGHWNGKESEDFYLEGHGKIKTKDLMYILGIFIGDGFIAYQQKRLDTKTGLGRKEYLANSRDLRSGRFKTIEKMGNHITTCRSYRIFFDIPEGDRCRKKVERTLDSLGIGYHCHKGKAGTHLYFTSKVFMEFFAQCGKKARNKRIPRWALDYAPKYLSCLLDGLMDSDGHQGGIYHTVSEKLASDICELCIKLNLKPTLRKIHKKSFLNGRKIEGDGYYVFVAKTTKSIARHRNKTINYKGDVWCLKVKDNKNFIVERNGKFDFCGNTDEVYGSIESGTFSETDRLEPSSPYSASKAGADMLVTAYQKTYGLPALITRSSNNYGPFQHPEKFIPKCVTNALRGRRIPVYGDGRNVRDWIFVRDNCEAIATVLERGKAGETYNIGTGEEKANLDVVRDILAITGKPDSLVKFVADRKGHDLRYALDCGKIRALGWKPAVAFAQGLRDTVQWYSANAQWWEPLI